MVQIDDFFFMRLIDTDIMYAFQVIQNNTILSSCIGWNANHIPYMRSSDWAIVNPFYWTPEFI